MYGEGARVCIVPSSALQIVEGTTYVLYQSSRRRAQEARTMAADGKGRVRRLRRRRTLLCHSCKKNF
jgi:hypothetical protein